MSLRNRIPLTDWDIELEEMLYVILCMQFITFAVLGIVLLQFADSILVASLGLLGWIGAVWAMYYGIKAHSNGVGWDDIQ